MLPDFNYFLTFSVFCTVLIAVVTQLADIKPTLLTAVFRRRTLLELLSSVHCFSSVLFTTTSVPEFLWQTNNSTAQKQDADGQKANMAINNSSQTGLAHSVLCRETVTM